MTSQQFVDHLSDQGILLWADEHAGHLHCEGPVGALSASVQDEIRRRKSALIDYIGAKQQAAPSFAEERIWAAQQLAPEAGMYNMPVMVELEGHLDTPALGRAVQYLESRHEALRTRYQSVDGQPRPEVDEVGQTELAIIDLEGRGDAADQAAAEWRRRLALQAFDLARDPLWRVVLLRLGPAQHQLVMVLHHIVADRQSVEILLTELDVAYRAFQVGDAVALPPLSSRYREFAYRTRQRMSGDALVSATEAGKERLASSRPLVIGPPRPDHEGMRFRGGVHTRSLSSVLRHRVHEFARAERVSPFAVMMAAYSAALHRYSGADAFAVGTPVSLRSGAEDEHVVGCFVNLVLVGVEIDPSASFRDLVSTVSASSLHALEERELPIGNLAAAMGQGSEKTFAQAVLAWHQSTGDGGGTREGGTTYLYETRLGDARARVMEPPSGTSKFDLTLDVTDHSHGLALRLEYDQDRLSEALAGRLLDHCADILREALSAPDRTLSLVARVAPEEGVIAPDPGVVASESLNSFQTIPARVLEQASRYPDRVALTVGPATITYGALVRQAEDMAARLRASGVQRGSRVAVCAEPSVEMIAGLVAVWLASGAYVPLDPHSPTERAEYILENSEADVVLVSREVAGPIRARLDTYPTIALEAPAEGEHAGLPEDVVSTLGSQDLAYVIYTSGSTGRPKGVGVSHGSVASLFEACHPRFGFGGEDVWTLFHSFAFDFSVWEIWGALAYGGRLVIVPESDRRLPERLLDLLERERVTMFNQTPSAFQRLSEVIPDVHRALQSVRWIVFGGEALSASHLRAWRDRIPVGGPTFVNMYGITETTVHVTYAEVAAEDLLPDAESRIGRPLSHLRGYVLDQRGHIVPAGVAGELYVGGAGLAHGYLSDSRQTAARFVPDAFSGLDGERLYRTGDRVRRLEDGSLAFVGRQDRQVKLRGFRIELGEIEAALERLPSIGQASVLLRTVGKTEALVAYVVATDETDAARLRAGLASSLPSYMVPAAYVFLPQLPITPNGKLDTKALPDPVYENEDHRTPRTPLEEDLCRLWADALGRDEVGIDEDFFQLGGHSLLLMQVISRVRKLVGWEVPAKYLFTAPTVAAFAQLLQEAPRPHAENQLVARDRGTKVPLALAQQRLWFLYRFAPGPAYHIAAGLQLNGALHVDVLRRSLTHLAQRHEILRTAFEERNGNPVQVVNDHAAIEWRQVDVTALPARRRASALRRLGRATVQRPFDLEGGATLRAYLVRQEAGARHTLLLAFHHIVADGWSIDLLLRELSKCYASLVRGEAPDLAPLPVQYADYAVWQRRRLEGAKAERDLEYWLDQLDGLAPVDLPLDRSRPRLQTYRGGRLSERMPPAVRIALDRVARHYRVTPFAVVLSALYVLLAKLTSGRDLVVGTPEAGRTHHDLEGLVGCFVNTLGIRIQLEEREDFGTLVRRVQETVVEAREHAEIPFERVVEGLNLPRDPSRHPVFQVMLSMEDDVLARPRAVLEGVEMKRVNLGDANAQFDLTVHIVGSPKETHVAFEYNTDLLDATTVSEWLTHFMTLLQGAVLAPETQVEHLPAFSIAQRRLLQGQQAQAAEIVTAQLSDLLDQQAAETPDAVAVVAGSHHVTYAWLQDQARHLAKTLQTSGIAPDTGVAVLLPTSIARIVAVRGVLAAGGYYVPLDPATPPMRRAALLDDLDPALVITTASQRVHLPARYQAEEPVVAEIAGGWDALALQVCPRSASTQREHDSKPRALGSPTSRTRRRLAYVRHTSGSTGTPKGVMVSVHGLTAHAMSIGAAFDITPGDRVLRFAAVSFDVSAEEVFPALIRGGTLVLPDASETSDLDGFTAMLRRERITIANLPSPFWHAWTARLAKQDADPPTALRHLVVGSAATERKAWAWWKTTASRALVLTNAYGLTETTITNTLFAEHAGAPQADEHVASVPIGRALATSSVYVLDHAMRPVPFGVEGQLYVGGDGVARGYWTRPRATAARFVPDPFSKRPGARLYRTGDRVRSKGGALHFVGRVDDQIALRGFRIEPAEVEAGLRRVAKLSAAVVVSRAPEVGEDPILVAYVVPEAAEAFVDQSAWCADVRARLESSMPRYLVPQAVVVLDALPLDGNGKVDKRALPSPAPRSQSAGQPLVTEVEQRVGDVWARILEKEPTGLDSDFFRMGGHSLLAMRLLAEIRDTFGLDVSLQAFFEHPTLGWLAEQVEADGTVPSGDGHSAPMLSDSEVEQLLSHLLRT
ncbi:MAG: amino acid adenylation domain-containing protein [Bacteroidota bacterium]